MTYVHTQVHPRKKIVVGSIQYHGKCYECQANYPFLVKKNATNWIKGHEGIFPQHHVTYYESAAVVD